MPYGAKLKLIKKEKRLTNSAIKDLCNVPLSTVTRLFDEENVSGNFETFVSIARGLNISLDELAGLKPMTQHPSLELLSEKDSKIERLLEENGHLREDVKTLREDNKALREDNSDLRKGKNIATRILVVLLIALALWIIIDLANGHFGSFRY